MESCNSILIHVLLAAALGSTAPTDSIVSTVSFSDTLNDWNKHCTQPTQHLCDIWDNASDNFLDKYRNQTAPEPSGVIIKRCDWRCKSCGINTNQIWGPILTKRVSYSIKINERRVDLIFENHESCGCLNNPKWRPRLSDRTYCTFSIKK